MDEPLLQTKLYIPVVHPAPATKLRTSLIPRPRLMEQLNEGLPRRAVAQDLHAPYALHLLNALREAVTTPQPLTEPLSERELQVLRRVTAGYSNQEIAQDLVLAVSTVKKHINNIYGKLGVGSRTQAAARARELGLM